MIATTAEKYKICPHCQSPNLVRQTGDNEPTKHYGRLKCGDCNRHIQWVKDPSVTIQQAQRNQAINHILQQHPTYLRIKDQQFLINIREKRYLTPKQQQYLNSISKRCLGINICLVKN